MTLRKAIVCALLAGGGLVLTQPVASAQSRPDGSSSPEEVVPALPSGSLPRYVVSYMSSLTGFSPRTATVISITNQTGGTCTTAVDWKVGFGGVSCTTTLALGPGQTGEHCSRNTPSGVATCNAICSPELTAIEGNAIVGSPQGCSKLLIYPRTFYFNGTTDDTLAAAADAKIVKVGAFQEGD